jgi:multidrug efflux system membrane fusion protein
MAADWRWTRSLVCFALPCAALACFLIGCSHGGGESGGSASDRGGKGGRGADRPVSVALGKAVRRDVAIWSEGLASVSAWQQVTVRAQVDGRLDQVFFKEGQSVKKGDVLAQIDPRAFQVQLHQAEGTLARDQTALTVAKLNLDRYERLRHDNLISQQQVDDQNAMAAQLAGAMKVDQASIEGAKLNLDYSRVRAPISGVVGIRQVDVGNLVHSTDANGLVVLTQLDPVAVFVTLPQDDLPTVAKAMARGDVPVEILARDGTSKLGTGKVTALDNQINNTTATLRLKVEVPNPSRLLWPNQFVKARLMVDTAKQVLTISADAVQRGPQGSFVYLVDQAKRANPTPVEVERTVDGLALLKTDLPTDAEVVVEGQGQLRPGALVSVRGAEDKGHAGKARDQGTKHP